MDLLDPVILSGDSTISGVNVTVEGTLNDDGDGMTRVPTAEGTGRTYAPDDRRKGYQRRLKHSDGVQLSTVRFNMVGHMAVHCFCSVCFRRGFLNIGCGGVETSASTATLSREARTMPSAHPHAPWVPHPLNTT